MRRFFSRKSSVEPQGIRKDPKERKLKVYGSISRIKELLPRLNLRDSAAARRPSRRRRSENAEHAAGRTTVHPVGQSRNGKDHTRTGLQESGQSGQERYGPYYINDRNKNAVFETIGGQTFTTSATQDDIQISGIVPSTEAIPHEQDSSTGAKHEYYSHRHNKLQAEIEQLRQTLKTREKSLNDETAKAEENRIQVEKLQYKLERLQDDRQQLMGKNHELESQTQGLKALMGEFQSTVHNHERENLQLRDALEETEKLMATYRNDIAKLSNERPDSNRDDHYLEQQFSLLFRSIASWVLKYYLTANPQFEDFSTLDPLFAEFLTGTLGSESEALVVLRTEPHYTIQAYIAFHVRTHILEPPLLGLHQGGYENTLRIIATSAALSPTGAEDLAKWRISTVKMITRLDEFWKEVSAKGQEIAAEIVRSLSALVPDHERQRYNPAPRTKKLLGIIDQAAKLAIELQKEPSTISYIQFGQGTLCVASNVTDAKGLQEDGALEELGACVQLSVYPAIFRRAFNSQQDIVIVKGKVLVSEPIL